MNTDKQIIDKLQLELNLLEENYALAFEIGTSPYVLNAIWKRIDLQRKIYLYSVFYQNLFKERCTID